MNVDAGGPDGPYETSRMATHTFRDALFGLLIRIGSAKHRLGGPCINVRDGGGDAGPDFCDRNTLLTIADDIVLMIRLPSQPTSALPTRVLIKSYFSSFALRLGVSGSRSLSSLT